MADPPASRPARRPRRAATDGDDGDVRDVGVIERCLGAGLSLGTGPDADLVCDVERAGGSDLGTIDAVAHLALTARRHERSLRVVGAPRALVDLLDLCGLADLLARFEAATEARKGPTGPTGPVDSVEPGR